MEASPPATPSASRLLAPNARNVFLRLLLTSRPLGWVASVGLFRIGMAYADTPDTPATVALSIALSWPFCLYLFGLNDLADTASDTLNPRKGSWIHGARFPETPSRLAHAAPWAGGAIVLASATLVPPRAALILAAILLVGWMYSSPPLRLKEIPIIDGLCTAVIMIGLLGAGYACGAPLVNIPAESYAVAPTLAGLHIFASVVDVDGDRIAGHKTLAVRSGPRTASVVALLLSLLTTATVPILWYAPPIAAYVLLQPVVFTVSLVAPKLLPPRRALVVAGIAGIATILHLALVYLR